MLMVLRVRGPGVPDAVRERILARSRPPLPTGHTQGTRRLAMKHASLISLLLLCTCSAHAQQAHQRRCETECFNDCPPRESCIRVGPDRCACLPDVPTGEPANGGTLWDLGRLEAGRTYPTEISARNASCPGRRKVRVTVEDAPWLRVTGPDTLTVRRGEVESTAAVVDLRGVTAGERTGRILLRCTNCPPPPACQTDFGELTVRVEVVARPDAGEQAAGLVEPAPQSLGHLESPEPLPIVLGSCEGLQDEQQRKLWKAAEEWEAGYKKLVEALGSMRTVGPEKPVSGSTVTGFAYPGKAPRACSITIEARFKMGTNLRADPVERLLNGRFSGTATVTSADPPCDVMILAAYYAQVADGTGKVTDHRWVSIPGGIGGGTGLACGGDGAAVDFDFTVPLASFGEAIDALAANPKISGAPAGSTVTYYVGLMVLAKDTYPCHAWKLFAAEPIDPKAPRRLP